MVKRYLVCGLIGVILVAFLCHNSIRQYCHDYGVRSTQEWLGNQPLALEHEQKILAIAQEMGVTEPLIIRKMN
jgi:hypothetical protein